MIGWLLRGPRNDLFGRPFEPGRGLETFSSRLSAEVRRTDATELRLELELAMVDARPVGSLRRRLSRCLHVNVGSRYCPSPDAVGLAVS